jgi:hypothetical protein
LNAEKPPTAVEVEATLAAEPAEADDAAVDVEVMFATRTCIFVIESRVIVLRLRGGHRANAKEHHHFF